MELTEQIRRKVVSDILKGKYSLGDKLPAEREMAQLTGTSRITVRRAYAQLERAGIITRNQNTGTCVSSTFKGNHEEIDQIAIIATLRDPFASDFIEEVNRTCYENDILNVLSIADMSSNCDQAELAADLASKGVRNIIVWGYDRNFDFSIFERLRILGINLVFFDRILPRAPYADFVGLDNSAAIRVLFEKALSYSREQIIFIDIKGLSVDSNDERKAEFFALCEEHNIQPELMHIGYLSKPSLQFAMRLLALEKAAIICVNDSVAMAIKNYVKGPSKVYSIDGTQEAVQAGILSYAQPMKEMAAAAVECLKKQQKLGEKWRASEFRFKGELLGQ
ncbi:MAG: hypothetical protein A2017_21000 [Lentisphaerae bacterium GWF2_44_16]|nr:MAG: hypothetical protein A2017_21000 [Lentisphaerae bacterium GWF2_44_16]